MPEDYNIIWIRKWMDAIHAYREITLKYFDWMEGLCQQWMAYSQMTKQQQPYLWFMPR